MSPSTPQLQGPDRAANCRRSRLAREIILVLTAKSLALLVIWLVWFAHPQAPDLDAERVKAALYSSHPVAQERTEPDAKP